MYISFGLLSLLFSFVLPVVLPIVAIVMVVRMKGRVKRLEAMTQSGVYKPAGGKAADMPNIKLSSEKEAGKKMSHERTEHTVTTAYPESKDFPAIPEYVAQDTGESGAFVRWLKDDWLLKLGALLLLIGFGWFVSYAFGQNWIGPVGRISLGILVGVAILSVGWWRIKSFIHQGGVLIALGSTIILITIYAAREIYGFFTPLTALALMFLAAATVALASVKYRSKALAVGSLILAGIAPLLTASPIDEVSIFSYLFVVVLGAIWIVLITGWRELTLAALILVGLYSVSYMGGGHGTVLMFAYAFAALFFITNTAGILKNKDGNVRGDMITAALNGMFLLAWITTSAPEEWKSLIISVWMLAFLLAAFAIFRITGNRNAFFIYAGVGVGMLAAATAEELSGAALTIAYTIESAIVALVVYLTSNDIDLADNTSLLLIGPAFLSLESIASPLWNYNSGIFHKDFFVLLVLSIVLFGSGIFSFLQRKISGLPSSGMTKSMVIAGSVFAYILLWLSLHSSFDNYDMATMTALVIYTIVGLAVYFYGKTNDKKTFLVYGGVMMGAVVLRLLLVDVWNMELSGRIITFFAVGGLLISTAFIGRKKKA